MSIFTKIVTGIFGKKSEKDLKLLSPFINEINAIFCNLSELSDDELKSRFNSIKNELIELSKNTYENFNDEKL